LPSIAQSAAEGHSCANRNPQIYSFKSQILNLKLFPATLPYDMRSQLTDANISSINGGNWVANYSYYKNGDMIKEQKG
jgi:hypothetical protein